MTNGPVGWVDLGAHEFVVSPVVVWFDATTGTAYEGTPTYSVSVRLSSYTDVPVTIPISVTGGTASGTDYSAMPASVTVPAGQAAASFTFGLVDDQLLEPAETLEISLGIPDNAVPGTAQSFTLLIRDNEVLYVDDDAAGGANDGSSWPNAFTDLQSALTKATAGSTIRVAAGTYTPTVVVLIRPSFQLKTGVAIYGGFAASAAQPASGTPLGEGLLSPCDPGPPPHALRHERPC